ncbi:MAG: pyridoxamine 5'-phosphate oxidase family protein [Candidatus Nitrohelix vancouverensis]|uniref:Pyridoxamine 5'-phosphate oxidase family protein n=1 Tax=Candidatus Nitrohelix vancouverensis TaxID=2705534 RepID=A0A7T0C502_9BACT|nr:MAG: pyridoxamine 5'-phosphate oxidase family protein [Candidatus Nitrohelix vancouverensis]
MSKLYTQLDEKLQAFILKQKLFFVGTADREGRVNVSPKGLDSLRIIDANRIAWLNLTGSGNETAAHVLEIPRMTLMFCSMEGDPMILRAYGTARMIQSRDDEWAEWKDLFPEYPGSRQIFLLDVDLVQTSCGFAVPLFEYVGDRDDLIYWTNKIGDDGVIKYWEKNNVKSLDGKPTKIFE